jgi:phosphoribosyl 1,2-cyclic phosphate phosphodiesterase
MIGCKCPVCTSLDPHNHRTRTSAIVSYDGKSILIDTTPELRLQCLANNIERVDAVLFTHAHADHIFGLDDIRRFNEMQGTIIPCYGAIDALKVIRQAFDYIFVPTQEGGGKPKIELVSISGPFSAVGIPIIPIPVMHGEVSVFGYRIGDFAYITDCSSIPASSIDLLQGLDVLVIGALRHQSHETHFTLAQAVEVALDLGARETYFVHMSHGLDHKKTNHELPPHIQLAYDGLVVDLPAS